MDVMERDNAVVFMHHTRGEFVIRNLAEDAGLHGFRFAPQ
jgi:hypothetical protein